jgi:aspartyl-tRNA(Asn)/glutamyl-tRNA(Gln) amidotransferase subunit A
VRRPDLHPTFHETTAMANSAADLTATALIEQYRRKTLSPVEATRAVLDRISSLQPSLNAFLLVDEESALSAARASEARWTKGAPLGAVDGVPASVKDVMIAKGWPTLRGSKTVSRDQPWDEDAPMVARLREQGAVLLGKTTTPEFGWKAIGDSPLTGISRNPWNRERTPGGSSAGAAIGAATGMGPLHLGSDGGGSIRIPSSFCGVFGIKPTYGLVAAAPPSPFAVVSHTGPMTRTVEDAALMLSVIAAWDGRDPYALPLPRRDYRDGLGGGVKGLRMAYSPALGYAKVDPEVRKLTEAAVRVLESQGAIVEQADPGFASPRDVFWALWTASCAKVVAGIDASQRDLVDPGLRVAAERGARLTAVDLIAAEGERALLMQKTNAFLARYDVLLTPTVAVPALPVGQDLDDPAIEEIWIDWTPFSYPFNMSRQPAANIPCGLTSSGLPVGMQAVAGLGRDDLVLRVARTYEEAHPFVMPRLA